MGIMYYLCYYLWRHHGAQFFMKSLSKLLMHLKGAGCGTSFVFFCLLGTIYSIYASSWASSTSQVIING
jgi:hypothetical protein